MINFNYSVPTKIFFGKDKINVLASEVKKVGSRVLMVYGKKSTKQNGLYDKVVNIFKKNSITFFELGGVDPNPKITSVKEGIKTCRENNVELVLAIGGGSSIDCAKTIAAGYYYNGNPWDIVKYPEKIKKVLPVATILTISATGSEMDQYAVISNMDTHEKLGTGHPDMAPKFSILDPTYTFTVPKIQTAAGISDMMSHIFEEYFSGPNGAFVQNRLCEALLKTCINYGKIAVDEPENYEARSNLMWTSSLALNSLLGCGKNSVWCAHPMEHELSAFYDITHGVGLAILTPVWMKYILDDTTVDKFVEYGINVWEIGKNEDKYEIANKSIEKTKDFFKSLGLPSKLSELGIDDSKFERMAKGAVRYGEIGGIKKLDENDVLNIYKKAL